MANENEYTVPEDQANLPRWRRSEDINARIEHLGQNSPIGSIDQAIGNTYYGLNHRQQPGAVPTNKDQQGLTFFTRPLMNLSTDNIRADRRMAPLLTSESKSLPRIIRCTLDPRLAKNMAGNITSEFVDPQQAFIPFLTNNLLSLSGIRDMAPATYTSPEGSHKESFSFVDGVALDYTTYTIDCTFRNIIGDPITSLFYYWLHYMSFVYEGAMIPYPEYMMENEIDYNTRIYRLILDPQKTYVQKIWACGAAFPVNNTIGNAFNFEHDKAYALANEQISIQFQCMGSMINDYRVMQEFNDVVIYFNPMMRDETRNDPESMTKVPQQILTLFNNRGYPHINLDTNELEWYVPTQMYRQVTGQNNLRNQQFSGAANQPEKLSPTENLVEEQDQNIELPQPMWEDIEAGINNVN